MLSRHHSPAKQAGVVRSFHPTRIPTPTLDELEIDVLEELLILEQEQGAVEAGRAEENSSFETLGEYFYNAEMTENSSSSQTAGECFYNAEMYENASSFQTAAAGEFFYNAEMYSYRAEIPNANDQEPELLTAMSRRVDNAVQILDEAFHQRKRKRFRPNSDKDSLSLAARGAFHKIG
eukprot:scaffold31843_cov102-Skeletonema_marinoi.AAC.1